ncbi:S-adenosyl-L-methionine-dependent methyltransferase [Stachybotrys elegans]|uniref:S-adenosyl-L-methionine-dependent methyltransferase n=1 Tax=Stachybotrys elegans TaxID=80388 RepID=A0A8K0T1F0_9HYPO|nr:S-adenosyl-L-methionine-dependent methyltransferase [Stachybotrys elegans]
MTYTQSHNAAVLSSHSSRTVQNSAAFLLPHLRPTDHVLDIGCGPGSITQGFAKVCSQGRVIGIDQSSYVVGQAAQTYPAADYPNLTFQAGDVLSEDGLPFPDNTFDVVYTSQTLIHIPDPVRAIREAYRLLKPGGVLAMREADSSNWYPKLQGLELYNRAMDAMIRSSGAPGFGNCRALHAWAHEAGFDRSRMKLGGDVLVYADPEQRRWWADGGLGRLKHDTEEGEEAKKQLVGEEGIAIMERDLRLWADDVDGWYSNYQVQVLCWK